MTARIIPIRQFARCAFEESDSELVAACALENPHALGLLFDRYHRDVYRFLSRLSGVSQRDLDDLVQETFVELYRCAGSFEGRSQVRSWIFGIASNVARHHARSEIRRRLFSERLMRESQECSGATDQAALRRETGERLAVAIRRLSHNLRTVFVLCEIEDLPGREVARALGIPEGTVFRRLHDARKKLRTYLKDRER